MATTGSHDRAVQIVELNAEGQGVTVKTEAIRQIGATLARSGADSVSIISVMGKYRSGKSFLLNFMIRYLQRLEREAGLRKERSDEAYKKAAWPLRAQGKHAEADSAGRAAAEEATKSLPEFPPPMSSEWRYKTKSLPPGWIHEGGDGCQEDTVGSDFTWQNGDESCTRGIWILNRPFMLYHGGQKVAVLLMDTQGESDGVLSAEQAATIFGLTALLSSKLVVNVSGVLSDNSLASVDYFSEVALATCAGFVEAGSRAFGHLQFLVRDFGSFAAGWDMQRCKDKMREHGSRFIDRGDARATRIQSLFSDAQCFCLPHPGLEVSDLEYGGSLETIGSDFYQVLDEFMRTFFSAEEFPIPSAPLGLTIAPAAFEQTILNFVRAFESSDLRHAMVDMHDALVIMRLNDARDKTVEQFRTLIERRLPRGTVLPPESFRDLETRLEALVQAFGRTTGSLNLGAERHEREVSEMRAGLTEKLSSRRLENEKDIGDGMRRVPCYGGGLAGCYFVSGHPYIDGAVALGGAVYWARSKARTVAAAQSNPSAKASPLTVARAMGDDLAAGVRTVRKDCQAISIGLSGCTPAVATQQAATVGRSAAGARRPSPRSRPRRSGGWPSGAPCRPPP